MLLEVNWLAAAKRVVVKFLVLSRHLHAILLAAAGCRKTVASVYNAYMCHLRWHGNMMYNKKETMSVGRK